MDLITRSDDERLATPEELPSVNDWCVLRDSLRAELESNKEMLEAVKSAVLQGDAALSRAEEAENAVEGARRERDVALCRAMIAEKGLEWIWKEQFVRTGQRVGGKYHVEWRTYKTGKEITVRGSGNGPLEAIESAWKEYELKEKP